MIRPFNIVQYRKLLVEQYNVHPADFDEEQAAWRAKTAWSSEDEKSFLWAFAEREIAKVLAAQKEPERKYQLLRSLYLLLWIFLLVEKKVGTGMIELANYFELKKAALMPYRTNVMIIGGERCPAAEAVNGMVVPIEEALVQQPIPYGQCSRPLGCICNYGFHGERDLEGKLIMK